MQCLISLTCQLTWHHFPVNWSKYDKLKYNKVHYPLSKLFESFRNRLNDRKTELFSMGDELHLNIFSLNLRCSSVQTVRDSRTTHSSMEFPRSHATKRLKDDFNIREILLRLICGSQIMWKAELENVTKKHKNTYNCHELCGGNKHDIQRNNHVI